MGSVSPKDGRLFKRKPNRRQFLRVLTAATPLAAAAGALAHIGVLTTRRGTAPDFPGHPAVWRSRFLQQARAERGAPATGDIIDAPVGPTDIPMVREISRGPIAVASPRQEVPTQHADLVRMQEELKRAMEKPIDQRLWIMVIDLRKCIGCSACTVACKAENMLPPGVVYRPVIEEEEGDYPNVTRHWLPRPCMQCDDPPCVPVCPVSATWKREDGIVVIDYNVCIGCRYCMAACPYGARYFDYGDYYTDDTPEEQPYEHQASPEYSRRWRRDGGSSPVGNVRKCQFCIHRLNAGMLPACVTTCIGGATYFGDKNDPHALVNELISRETLSGRTMRLKEDLGTEPKVYYLV